MSGPASYSKRKALATPYPEALTPGERWHVVDDGSAPHVDLKGRAMFAPFNDDALSRYLRAHEQAHVRWTPPTMRAKRAPHYVLNVVEDARIEGGLRANHVPAVCVDTLGERADAEAARIVGALVSNPAVVPITLALVASHNAPGELNRVRLWQRLCDGLGRRHPVLLAARDIAHEACRALDRACVEKSRAKRLIARPKSAVMIADWLSDALGLSPGMKGKADAQGDGEQDADDVPARPDVGLPDRTGRNDAGDMTTHVHKGLLAVSNAVGRRWRAADSGTRLRYFHRDVVEREFQRRRRVPGGSVLIDCSGSMSLSYDDVAAILRAAPAAVVGLYSGSGRSGVLHVVAQRGRMVSEPTLRQLLARMPGGNVVDAPALEWLAKQRAPRLWVSDGCVTCAGDQWPGPQLAERIKDTCVSARIVRCLRPEEAGAALSAQRKHGRMRSIEADGERYHAM